MSNTEINGSEKRLSTLESQSPVDLYWLHRDNKSDVSALQGGNSTISELFWDEFIIAAKAAKIRNPEATIYDAFNFVREHFLGGWTMLENSPFIKEIDQQIEKEYQREQRKKR